MKYYCVIVTYNPDLKHLENIVINMLNASMGVVIFDNTPEEVVKDKFSVSSQAGSIEVISEGENRGLSYAFNTSVKHVRKHDPEVEAFLFFDQDSTVLEDSLIRLCSSYNYLVQKDVPFGVLGANPVDLNGERYKVNKSASINLELMDNKYLSAQFVISSFSLVPTVNFDAIGYFDEDLFIDLVDSEFCFRCTKYGLLNIIDQSIEFTHVVGNSRISFFGRKLSVSSPLRNYYQTRNIILVAKKYGWIFWSLKLLCRRFIQFGLSGIKEKNIFVRYKFMVKGLYDGLSCNVGKIKD